MLGLSVLSVPAQAESIKDKVDNLQISGFVDSSWSSTNAVAGATSTGFGLDAVELDVEYTEDNVGMRFDLNGAPSAGGNVTQDGLLEQGYVFVNFPAGEDAVTFKFGKFNAPIGWELLDAPDMYQFSHSLVFNNGLPVNLTGASLSAAFGMVDGVIYYADKVDTNGVTTTGVHSAGSRIGLTPLEGVNVGFSYLNTNNPGTVATRTLDVDFTYDAIENLVIGAEYNQITDYTPNVNAGGYFATIHYDFTDMFGATYRYGNFDFDTNLAGKATQNTFALTSAVGGGLGALFEYSTITDTSGTLVTAGFTQKTYAFEMTYSF
ncbi:MAG: hypothetical protein CO186_04210 [Zetaproteobacteria bacterium CG_4_9_14_3_um_filter_49_83]|nr:MAG: hypothetical protein AUJ56_03320 [Zetaproteobacteria bacterium CG1_02_49_23]PIQ33077.1 MAG: hypothetical protein COW62_06350 [Zetaproteobacteria bacterium CG17_big_fil_post_rev_8_21_14_2_50_50_13]PIV31383.1 MAG: hypothetical protein COS35_01705 [Zetaproteobacteria bacterium CG02_land_8_20_14_3_00_50_9]PIY56352.1 MAG: hypothetical protein COZ00_04770 [Zetaproteobacteria bacterium CG_4_10_14_0_8_um_filter_49_80]PJA35778.1 MAG: hypothetical protein CO186_04210 [Zetaproteobacteria bacterium